VVSFPLVKFCFVVGSCSGQVADTTDRIKRAITITTIGKLTAVHSLRVRHSASAGYDFTFLVERAVMTPDIAKIDPDRDFDLDSSAWCFRDEVLRLLLHPHSLSLSRVTVSSHLSVGSSADPPQPVKTGPLESLAGQISPAPSR
jgi:hypothetical protein